MVGTLDMNLGRVGVDLPGGQNCALHRVRTTPFAAVVWWACRVEWVGAERRAGVVLEYRQRCVLRTRGRRVAAWPQQSLAVPLLGPTLHGVRGPWFPLFPVLWLPVQKQAAHGAGAEFDEVQQFNFPHDRPEPTSG